MAKEDVETIVIDEASEMNVISFGKTVIVRQSAKEVFVWGGDAIIEGRVEGDVATLGGSVIQKENAYIGGAVIVIGGAYKPESKTPLRVEGKETVMFGMFEEEFRGMTQDPSQILAPSLTPAFLAQRVLSALFWFVVTFAFATIAPGAVSRAIMRLQFSSLRVVGFGVATLIGITVFLIASLQLLPDYAGAVVGFMGFALLMLAYGFGRIVLQVSVGKAINKRINSAPGRSEAVSILIGVLFWTLLLSIPYVWTFAVVALFSAGVGLILTAGSKVGWKSA
ncbi:MAG: hypothetical protein QUS14_16235 [Pyrinomonadaceae bacterium]|nr:hypothetical protein [Pyrinomonadaceae bacterium]